MDSAAQVVQRTSEALGNVRLHHFGPDCDIRGIAARSYHWNIFRYSADITHLAALALCLTIVLRGLSAEGVSLKTHVLFLVVFSLRYLNIFVCKQFAYLLLYKVGFWAATLVIVIVCYVRGAARDEKDTCPVQLLLFPTVLLTLLFAQYHSVFEVLWIFSQHVEGIAMLPQYVYCYRDKGNRRGDVLTYVLCLGGYRTLYGLNWIYKYFFQPSYVDLSSWIAAVVNVIFFADFVAFKICCGTSPLSRLVLTLDDGLRDAKAQASISLQAVPSLRGILCAERPQARAAMTFGRHSLDKDVTLSEAVEMSREVSTERQQGSSREM